MKQRAIIVIRNIIVLLIAGALYVAFIRTTGISIPCIFHKITGYYCPGCGITRMCLDILKFNFVDAYNANKVVFILLPVIAMIFTYQIYRYIKYNDRQPGKAQYALLCCLIIILLTWGVVRNF